MLSFLRQPGANYPVFDDAFVDRCTSWLTTPCVGFPETYADSDLTEVFLAHLRTIQSNDDTAKLTTVYEQLNLLAEKSKGLQPKSYRTAQQRGLKQVAHLINAQINDMHTTPIFQTWLQQKNPILNEIRRLEDTKHKDIRSIEGDIFTTKLYICCTAASCCMQTLTLVPLIWMFCDSRFRDPPSATRRCGDSL